MKTLVGSILAPNGSNMLTAVFGGGLGPNSEPLNTNRTSANTWETFTLILQPGSPPIGPGMRFALRTSSGSNYLTAVNGGGVSGPNDASCPVHTNATSAGPWEMFTLVVNDALNPPTVQIMPSGAQPNVGPYYLTAVNGGGVGGPNTQPVHTDATIIGPWEQFSFSPAVVYSNPIVINCNTNIDGLANGNIAGSLSLTIDSDGSYVFSGKENNSSWAPYNVAVAVVVVGSDRAAYTFAAQGKVDAGLPWDNNNWNWTNNGNNAAIQSNWQTSLGPGWTWYYNISATLDVNDLLNALIQSLQTAETIAQLIYPIVSA